MLKHRSKPGFSLIEVLVMAGIISTAFISVMYLVERSIKIYYSNENYLVATVIAQEGLEAATYIRDNNWLNQATFQSGLAQITDATAKINATAGGVKTIFAVDHGALIGASSHQGIKQFCYIDKDGTVFNSQNQLPDIGAGTSVSGECDLKAHVKNDWAAVFIDSADHNFYKVRAAIDNFDAGRYRPTIFSHLLQTVYYDNGTPDDKKDDHIYVISMVRWLDRGAEKYFTLTTYLDNYNWKY